jgi:hypothetical protein
MSTARRIAAAVALLLGASLLSLVPATSAGAVGEIATTAHFSLRGKAKDTGTIGDYHRNFEGQVTYVAADGTETVVPWDTGEVHLERRWVGESTWRRIASDGNKVQPFFDTDATFRRNANYRIVYDGGSSASAGGVYAPSVSGVVKVRVRRDIRVVDHGHENVHRMRGRVKPKWKHHKVKIQVKKCGKCHWKTYRKVRTNKRSVFHVRMRATPHKRRYRAVVKGTKKYVKTKSYALHVQRHNYHCPAILCG